VFKQTPTLTNDNVLVVPGLYSALNYVDFHDVSPESTKQTCHNSLDLGVDLQLAEDAVCGNATAFINNNVTCTLAFTEGDESMTLIGRGCTCTVAFTEAGESMIFLLYTDIAQKTS
jgi:hypothetical protein